MKGLWAVSSKGSLGGLNLELYRAERILQTSMLQQSGGGQIWGPDLFHSSCKSFQVHSRLSLHNYLELDNFIPDTDAVIPISCCVQNSMVLFQHLHVMGFFILTVSFLTQNRCSINIWWVDKQVNCLMSENPIHRYLLKHW